MKKKAISLLLALSMSLMMFVGIAPTTMAAPDSTTIVSFATDGEIINGKYYVNGELVKGIGVVKVSDDYYYIGMRGQVFVGTVSVTATKTNGLVEAGVYEFGDDGKMIVNTESVQIKNGKYYVNGELVKNAGLIKIDNDYYYIGMRGQVFVGTVSVTAAKTNGLVEAGIYEFGDDGKMIINAESVQIKNGKYYVNGELVKGAGVVNVNDKFYYIGMRGQVFAGSVYVTAEKSNGLIPTGTYEFTADGISVEVTTDTDTQTETDTEISSEIIIYEGAGVTTSGWDGIKVADLNGFVPDEGGILRATFASSYNNQFKFAANNPTWDEILSAYFYEDCITVNSDTMEFTLSASDAAAFVGKSELWIVGNGVTVTKLVYIPNGNVNTDTDTETETDTDTQTETDTDTATETDTEVEEGIVIYNGSGVITSGWEGVKVADLTGNFTAQKGGVLKATFANSYNGKFKFAANDPTWIEILSAYFYEDCITVNADTMEFTLSAFDATAFVGKSELWITGDGVTLKKLVYIPSDDTDTDSLTPYEKHGALAVNGRRLVDKNGDPFQLYGMSTHGIYWHPQFVSLETFQNLCDWGVNCIRIAMYTDEYGGYCTYEPNESYLKGKVEDAIRYASQLGIYVIVDWHVLQDENPLKYKDKALDFFNYISSKYAGYDNILYEICNEPNGTTTWDDVKSYANEVIPLIRGNDSNAVILVGTTSWCLDVHLALQSPLNYDNIMYDFHFYANSHKQYYRDRVESCLNSGLPIFVTEFGTCDASGGGTVNYDEANAWKALIENYGLSFMCWNLSNQDESSSLILNSCNKTYGWSDSELSDQGRWIKAWFLEKKGTQ